MLLRPIFFALALGILIPDALVAEDAFSTVDFESAPRSAAPQTVFLGVMGEVARPGVYAAQTGSTLAQLLKGAGGVTDAANQTVRVFRGGRLAQQMFLSAREPPVLFAGDLVVVESRPDIRPPSRAGDGNRRTLKTAPSSEVQIAFLNIIDRPVVVKMLAGQATVTRIVEFLRQPEQIVSLVRVLPLSFADRRAHRSDSGPNDLLSSGTVLVFPRRSVRLATLPALPAPIVKSPIDALLVTPVDDWNQGPKRTHASIRTGDIAAVAGQFRTAAATDEDNRVQALADTHDASITQVESQESDTLRTPREDASRDDFDQTERAILDGAESLPLAPKLTDSRTKWLIVVVSSLGTVAALAMLLTLASIIRRQSGPATLWARCRQLASRLARQVRMSTGDSSMALRFIPVPKGIASVGRPLRIDANQPITRLGIDLSVVEPKERAAA